MLARRLIPRVLSSFGLLAVFAASARPLPAQAPRATAEAGAGTARLLIEYGSPPWSDERQAQIDRMLPVGAMWRLGADRRTTLVVEGGDCALGGVLIESGGYGLNVLRRAEQEWAFVIFDGTDATVLLGDQAWEIPAHVEQKSGSAPPGLVVAFQEAEGKQALVVRFGPIELSAGLSAVETREAELTLRGEEAAARWFTRAVGDSRPAGGFVRVGRIGSFFVGDTDAAFDVDLALDGKTAKVRFTNRERARLVDRIARHQREIDAAKSAAGSGARRAPARLPTLEAGKTRLEEELAGLALAPEPLVVNVPLKAATQLPGKPGRTDRVGAELVRRDEKLFIVVAAGDLAGELALDEARILPRTEK